MRLRYLLAILSLFILAPQTWAGTFAPLHRATFANGVHLVVEEDHSAPEAIIEIWLKVGGRDEVPGKTGLAHVLEHMMFNGSQKLKPGEFDRRIAAMGGVDNAFTTTDYTAYFEIIPATRVDEVMGMEADRFGHLRLDPKVFAKEIKVIMEERRMRTDDDPTSRMFEELSAVALRLSPYRNPVIGWMQDLKHLNIDDVRAFYRKHYVPGNATVVVVGDVNFANIKKLVERTFGQLKKQPVPPRFDPVEPEPLGPKRLTAHLPGVQLPMLVVAMPVPVWHPGHNDREAAAIDVATELLSGGHSALLNRDLVDRQRTAFSTGAGYDPFGMGIDLWYAYGMLGPKQSPRLFEQSFWKLVTELQKKGPDAAHLAASKRRLIADEVFAQDSLYLRAKQIGKMDTVGIGADHRGDWLAAIRKITAKDVQQVLKRWIRPVRATTGLLQPEMKP